MEHKLESMINEPLNEDEKNRLFMTLDLHTRQNEKIERALYGDKENRVKGLMERTTNIETWITKSNLKIAYVTGMVVVATYFTSVAWEWLKGKLK
jgi:hypothetical protein